MIIKTFELKKEKLENYKFFLLYGNNKGFIEETIENNLKSILPKNIDRYEENEILQSPENFKERLLTKSFFEDKKLIIITRVTDKIYEIIENTIGKNLEDISMILEGSQLDKKSKLRNYFEKNTKTVCIPFYEDNNQTLDIITKKFLKEKNINLSQQNINLIIDRCKGDRLNLKIELNKIELYSKNKKKVDYDEIFKLTNLAENYDISELVENSLAKNQRKTLNILNENNFGSEDCVLIIRIFLSKLKRLLKLKSEFIKNKNLEKTISAYKPPIFWKEKELLKHQVKIWDYHKIEDLITKINNLEYEIKKNPNISIYLVTDFILEKTLRVNN
tara:strand:- start:735 stop:1730 length:996 start_codon:yes stop_codon:yes gene_type:complete